MELAEETLAIARKTIQKNGNKLSDKGEASGGFLSVASAARYLRGYGQDARKAGRNLAATYEYREELEMESMGRDEESAKLIWGELKKRNMFIGSYEDDDPDSSKKSPIVVIRKRREPFEIQEYEDYRKSFVFMLHCTGKMADRQHERGVGADDVNGETGQWVIVMDMATLEKANSPPLSVTMETMKIFQRHFPERAKRIVIVDAPPAFQFIWRLVNPLIDAVTREKFVFVSRGDGDEKLEKELGPAVVRCIHMDLLEGKKTCAALMVEHGLLLDGFGEL